MLQTSDGQATAGEHRTEAAVRPAHAHAGIGPFFPPANWTGLSLDRSAHPAPQKPGSPCSGPSGRYAAAQGWLRGLRYRAENPTDDPRTGSRRGPDTDSDVTSPLQLVTSASPPRDAKYIFPLKALCLSTLYRAIPCNAGRWAPFFPFRNSLSCAAERPSRQAVHAESHQSEPNSRCSSGDMLTNLWTHAPHSRALQLSVAAQ